jgi:hypothetical protein
VLTDVIIRITFLTFLRVAANWSFIAMAQRMNSTAPASGSLGLEPRLPPARDHADSTDYSDRLSAWELACHALVDMHIASVSLFGCP